ncbi:hypothetical protein [Burkholderia ubonensis]|uniref:hypothetical protein n=1 Tax=Burkholderia ubonensis TaxID=101571 RepID=UPI0012FA050F|nr:hypothetical protein [Burkholderia ubonensis]
MSTACDWPFVRNSTCNAWVSGLWLMMPPCSFPVLLEISNAVRIAAEILGSCSRARGGGGAVPVRCGVWNGPRFSSTGDGCADPANRSKASNEPDIVDPEPSLLCELRRGNPVRMWLGRGLFDADEVCCEDVSLACVDSFDMPLTPDV